SLEADKSSILGVSASGDHITVREELAYKVDHTLMGAYSMYENVPLTAVVNKMLCVLPEEPMTPRLADSRLGLTTQLKSDFAGAGQEVRNIRYAKRWRIEPSDSAAYRRGELVEPKKQLVFYIDSLLPVKWHPYVKAGAESWNKAFEKIGFKNVICVKEFPENDTLFNAHSLDCMTIRYSASWMNNAQTTLHTDARTGEILNASILINSNMISVQYIDRIAATAAVDPRVRTDIFPQEIQGELIQAAIAQAVGTGLGLAPNWGAPVAYPVDSLRSASFTQQYGLASSVMGGVVINDVATADDVRKGVRLVNTNPGPYDELVIKYLYQPVYASSLQEEKAILDSWIRQHTGDPRYAYIRSQSRFDSDPRNSRGGLGDDHLKSFDYMLSNIRTGCENYYTWFSKGDKDMTMRKRVYSALCERLNSRVYAVLSYVGGIYLNDIREKDVIPSYSMVDREKQKAALDRVLSLAKDLDWIENTARATDFTIADKKTDMMRLDMFKNIFNRLPYIEVCTERFPETAYTASEYLDDIYNVVWEGTLKHRPLDNVEKALQTAFLESIISTSTVTAPIGSFKASRTSFADTWKSEINLTALREGENVEQYLRSLQTPEEISGFSSVPP
ncbi:MAG: zinc-dependent metalloprotease, partial [Bacteroides sp.]|nr:zinc-dependent metalloprotease [Bacteroides sp.]